MDEPELLKSILELISKREHQNAGMGFDGPSFGDHFLDTYVALHPNNECREQICDRSKNRKYLYLTFPRKFLPVIRDIVTRINPKVFRGHTHIVPYYKSFYKPPERVGMIIEVAHMYKYFPQYHILMGFLRALPTHLPVTADPIKWLCEKGAMTANYHTIQSIINTSLHTSNVFEAFLLILCEYRFPHVRAEQYCMHDKNGGIGGIYRDTIGNWRQMKYSHPPTAGQGMFWLDAIASSMTKEKYWKNISDRRHKLKSEFNRPKIKLVTEETTKKQEHSKGWGVCGKKPYFEFKQ